MGIRGIPENALRVRIDVRKDRCLLSVQSIRDEDDRDLRDYCDINGTLLGRGIYVCDVPDPWVVVKCDGFHDLKLIFDVLEVSDVSLMKALQSETAACADRIETLNGTIEQKENYIGEQREQLSERDRKILELNGVIQNKENYICEQREQLSERDRKILELNGVIQNKENYICEQREQLSEKTAKLDRLGAAIREALTGGDNVEIPEIDYLCGFLNWRIVRTLFRFFVKAKRRKDHAD